MGAVVRHKERKLKDKQFFKKRANKHFQTKHKVKRNKNSEDQSLGCAKKLKNNKSHFKSGDVVELANESVVHPRDLGSNLGIDRKYFLILFVLHLNSSL